MLLAFKVCFKIRGFKETMASQKEMFGRLSF